MGLGPFFPDPVPDELAVGLFDVGEPACRAAARNEIVRRAFAVREVPCRPADSLLARIVAVHDLYPSLRGVQIVFPRTVVLAGAPFGHEYGQTVEVVLQVVVVVVRSGVKVDIPSSISHCL